MQEDNEQLAMSNEQLEINELILLCQIRINRFYP